MSNSYQKLHVISFGLALGIVWGVGLFLLGMVSWNTGVGTVWIDTFGSVYLGYKATLMGSVLGFIWGFFDSFIAGVCIAWVYNFFSRKLG